MPEFGLFVLISIAAAATFGTIELYERVYRPRIEKNKDRLFKYANAELKSLVKRIKIPVDKKTMNELPTELDRINKLVKRPSDFLGWRKYLLIFLVILSIVVSYGVYNPTELFLDYPVYAWCIFLFIGDLIAIGYYLYEVWKIDGTISEMGRKITPKR